MISLRRAILAVAVFLGCPSGIWWLATHQKALSALILFGLTILYVAAEVVAFELRDHRAADAHRRYEHAMAGPLTGYCPQTDDRYFDQVESRRWMA